MLQKLMVLFFQLFIFIIPFDTYDLIQALRLKICDSHLTCKVANKCLNVREWVEVVEWNKMVHSLPLLSCELSVSVKENPDRKKIFDT